MSGAAIPDLKAAVTDLINRDAVVIPPYPGVAMRLQQLVGTNNYGMNDLAKVAMSDPVVTGFLLRAANSAALRGRDQITSVSAAVSRLGASEVVRIAIAASLGAEAGRKGALAVLRKQVWQRSLTSAVVCFQLANARRLDGQEGFVCGLLHDIGEVVTVSCLETLLSKHKDERMLSADAWMAFVRDFHGELGVLTATKWKLSEVLQTVIANHHLPSYTGAHQQAVDLVRATDEVVDLILDDPLVTQERLAALPSVSPAEAQILYAAIPGIAPFVASMDEVAAPPAGPALVSQVAAAPAKPDAEKSKADFPVTFIKAGGQMDGHCYGLTKATLTVVTKERQPAKYLAKLQLRPPMTAPFEVHASVEDCRPDPEGFAVEMKLFALSGGAKDKWAAILAALGLASAAAPPSAPSPRDDRRVAARATR